MSETKNRGWIKNVIIIFLVVMLLLTLFSNTIMNRSLPEVSVSNAQSGTITSQIKLSGNVSANQVKQITLTEARTIDTVMVRRGDVIERGTVLATLVAGESSEIYDLEIELRRLEIEYKQLLLREGDSLIVHQRTIEDSKKALAALQTYIDGYPALEKAVKGREDQITVLENNIKTVEQQMEKLEKSVETLEESIADLQKQQADYSDGGYTTKKNFEKEIERLEKALERAEDAASAAKRERSTALQSYNAAQAALTAYDEAVGEQTDLAEAIESLEASITAKKEEKKTLKKQYDDLRASLTPENTATLQPQLDTLNAKIEAADDAIDTLEQSLDAKKDALENATGTVGGMPTRAELEATLAEKKDAYTAANQSYAAAEDAEDEAKDALDAYSDEGFAYFLLQSRIDEYEKQKEPINAEQKEKEEEKEDLEEQLAEAQELLEEAEKEIEKTLEECEDEKLELTRAMEDAERALAIAKSNGAIEDETAALNLSIKKTEIDRKKKQIEKLKTEITETEIIAPVGGTVATVGITSGDEVEANTVAFEITMTDMGYTMECSVTNSQAARLRVGQEAEVQYYYWGAKPSVRITQIAGDPNSGGKNKLVTFTVEGDVSEGTALSLVIGSQGASYDTVVPNSAIREDANGQFILKVAPKASPLGNRYYAERLDVEVLASDATKSAINATLSWGDYVITGASVPISEGMQVRMAE